MEMPKPNQNHDKLKALTGTWSGQETMSPSPWDSKGGTATGVIEAHLDLDGMFLVSQYRQEREGRVTYRGHGVYGWDEKQKVYTMYWFDSVGTDPGGPARGKWEGDSLIFEMKGEMGHSRYAYKFHGDGKFDFSISRSSDGKSWSQWLESTWTRR